MPELPEVETTTRGLKTHTVGLKILDIWSEYESRYFEGKDNIKDPKYFLYFKKQILGKKIIDVERRAKNILIHLDNNMTILTHMKMTGHYLYGIFEKNIRNNKIHWSPLKPLGLKDPYNRHIRLVFSLSNKYSLALCDSRKFAKITLIHKSDLKSSPHLSHLGPEPLSPSFSQETFIEKMKTKNIWPIKRALMDQSLISGVGNIYADEALWLSGIHPMKKICDINTRDFVNLFKAIREVLSKGIDFGGDSMSDYRNIHGEKGAFQAKHNAYKKTGEKCRKRGCGGIIRRIVIGARSAHYCDKHQKLS